MDSQDSMNAIPLDMKVRCPDYFKSDFSVKIDSQIKQYTATYHYDNLEHFENERKAPVFVLKDLPSEFNITGKIDVKTNGQAFSFYY